MANRSASNGSHAGSRDTVPVQADGSGLRDEDRDVELVDRGDDRKGSPSTINGPTRSYRTVDLSNALPSFGALGDAIKGARRPYGSEEDPCWQLDAEAMATICSRMLPDGIRHREVPRMTIVAVEGGFEATLTDSTISYKCMWRFKLLADFFPAFCEAFRRRECWKEVKFGEGHQKRMAEVRKRIDERKLES